MNLSLRVKSIAAGAAVLLLAACTTSAQPASGTVATADGVALTRAFDNLTFERPVDLQYAPGTNWLFVVEQQGRILVFDRDHPDRGTSVFLDIRNRVEDSGNEQGLLGLAFHPDFQKNGAFYANYTARGANRTVISRFTVPGTTTGETGRPPVADASSEAIVLEFSQPYRNHNGGQIAFGPDGYLYIATGDGGSGGDPRGNGQNPNTLLGAILRIDVDGTSEGAYGIPPSNPFVGMANHRPEIYAYGLRNPWRLSFDPQTGALWAADVGQNAYEEVDIVVAGGNYGWNIMEGSHRYSGSGSTEGLIPPVAEYGHSEGKSITGGFVYRGSAVTRLAGNYVYADFVSGRFWTHRADDPGNARSQRLFDTDLNVASFGVDQDGELYVLAFDGALYRFEAN